MKKTRLWMMSAILTFCGSVMTLTSCSKEDNTVADNTVPDNTTSDIERLRLEEWKPCNKLTYISGIESENPDLQAVIRQRFPNQTQSLSNAEVAFVSFTTAKANLNELGDFYKRGGLIVMMRPTENDFDTMGDDYLNTGEEGEEGYWDDAVEYDELFTDDDEMDEIFFAYNRYNAHYTMYEEPEFDGNYTDEINEMPEEEWEAMQAAYEQNPEDSELHNVEWIYDNDYAQNYNYFQARIGAFVDFVEEIEQQNQTRSSRTRITRAGDGGDDGSDMKLEVEDGYFFVKDMPVSLNHRIEKDYTWNKNSTVTIRYWVSSVYMLSSNGENKAGDYYMVKSEVIPHITPLWEVAARAGGLANWGRCRIYAYWFDNMTVEYELLDANNNSLTDRIQYYKTPIPDNENTETSYTKGFTWGLNGSLSGEGGAEGGKGGLNLGFSLEWSSESSYALKDIQYERNALTAAPSFRYVANVNLKDDDYEDERKTNANFKPITHTEFSARTAWLWRVPGNSRVGAADNSKTNFKLRVRVKPVYASWYHWRWTAQYDSNKRTYNGYVGSADGWFSHSEPIPAPDRTPWGVVVLKNAASAYTIGNIKIYKQSEFDENGVNARVYATIPSSYNMNEVAKKSIPEGTYTLTFQAIDPNQNNKLLGNWKYENIKIEQGKSLSDATTEISTINAVLIN